jgi:predicted kinase
MLSGCPRCCYLSYFPPFVCQSCQTLGHATLFLYLVFHDFVRCHVSAPGSGKSTMAMMLQQVIGRFVIDHDIIRSSLLEGVPFDQAAKSAYRLQWKLAEQAVKHGLNIIIDSTCNFPEVIDQASELAERYGFSYWYIECKVEDINLLDERLRTRVPMESQRTGVNCPPAAAIDSRQGEDSRTLFKKWIENPCRPEHNAIIVDSTGNLEMHRGHILNQITCASPKSSAQASDK